MRHFRLSSKHVTSTSSILLNYYFFNIKTQPISLNISQTGDQLYRDLYCVIYFLTDQECHIFNFTDSDLSLQDPLFLLLWINFCTIYAISLNEDIANHCLPPTNSQNFNVSKLRWLKKQGRMRRGLWGMGTAC